MGRAEPEGCTFKQGWAAYKVDMLERGLSESTIRQYKIRLTTWATWVETRSQHRPAKPWWRAGPEDLRTFCTRAARPGARIHVKGAPLSPATRAMYTTTVPALYHVCYRERLIPADPFAGYRPLRRPDPNPEPLDQEAVRALLDGAVFLEDERIELLAALCYYCLLRSGEPARLTVSDVDLHGAPARLRVWRKGRREPEWIALHPATVPVLERHLGRIAARYGVGDWRKLPDGTPLVGSRSRPGLPVTPGYATKLLARAMRDLGVDGRPHDLRRTAAQAINDHFEDNPGPVRVALGHRGYSALKHYVRPGLARQLTYLQAVPDPRGRPAGRLAAVGRSAAEDDRSDRQAEAGGRDRADDRR
jgi:integrase